MSNHSILFFRKLFQRQSLHCRQIHLSAMETLSLEQLAEKEDRMVAHAPNRPSTASTCQVAAGPDSIETFKQSMEDKVSGLQQAVQELFKLTRMDRIFQCYETVETALAD